MTAESEHYKEARVFERELEKAQDRIAQLEAELATQKQLREDMYNAVVGVERLERANRGAERVAKLEADVRTLREALSAAFQSMVNAHHRLKSPDMGGTYLDRARETLVAGKSAVLAAFAATKPKEGGR